MTDNEITAYLNAIGLLFDGTVTLTKEIGREEPNVETTMHPLFGLFCCLSGLEELTWQAMHAGGSLKLNLENEEQVSDLFEDLCTQKEIEKMAERLYAARLLMAGNTYSQVIAQSEISSATLSRVSRCVQYGTGYSRVLKGKEGQ